MVNDELFTQEELVADGMTPEEADSFLDALALADTANQLPDDVPAFIKKYNENVPDNFKDAFNYIVGTAKTDTEFFQNLMALSIVINHDTANRPVEIKETVYTKLPPEVKKRVSDNYFRKLATMSEEERLEFIKLIENITEEQKAELINRLK